MNIVKGQNGWIEVICGSMFSGKTEELIRRMRRVEIAKHPYQIFKPTIDNRYHHQYIVSHDKSKLNSTQVDNSQQLYEQVKKETEVVGIDEAQFFDDGLVEVCQKLANEGKRVIVAGLDQDYLGKPFHPMPELLATSEYITKTLAICMQCGNPANRTQRLIDSDEEILVGEKDIYEARCRKCFKPLKEKK
ncbi:MAG TPA: thymidine kinase [Candidatus Cloacimonetes bacterium]|nr:thymidine kinase [Candidatus Cloacimonadota bacterium]